MAAVPISEDRLRDVLAEYLTILQRHPSAEEMMAAILTEDFETGFVGGHLWKGLDGLRDFLSQREGLFDEHHEVKDVLELEGSDDQAEARTRLEFFLRGRAQRSLAASSPGPPSTPGACAWWTGNGGSPPSSSTASTTSTTTPRSSSRRPTRD
jgi:SnoaL-like domain